MQLWYCFKLGSITISILIQVQFCQYEWHTTALSYLAIPQQQPIRTSSTEDQLNTNVVTAVNNNINCKQKI